MFEELQLLFYNSPDFTTPIELVLVPYIITYLVCGIPFGKIFAWLFGRIDLQKVGSGNIGTTNALRAGGLKVAIPTLLCDVLKGVVCINLVRSSLSGFEVYGTPNLYSAYLAIDGMICLLGHMFSPYLKFRGGKGIATGVGVLFGISWPFALIHLGIFIVVVAVTRYVSVGSIATVLALMVTVPLYFPDSSLTFKVIMIALGWLVVWAHRGNIKKLRNGTESKLSFSKRVKKMDE